MAFLLGVEERKQRAAAARSGPPLSLRENQGPQQVGEGTRSAPGPTAHPIPSRSPYSVLPRYSSTPAAPCKSTSRGRRGSRTRSPAPPQPRSPGPGAHVLLYSVSIQERRGRPRWLSGSMPEAALAWRRWRLGQLGSPSLIAQQRREDAGGPGAASCGRNR